MNAVKRFFLNNYWFIIGILLSLMLILLWFASFGEYQFTSMFSSDALYLPSIYEDIFVNGNSVQGWTFNPAPNFIPDMLLFFILMGITSNFLTATFLFSIIQYFAIIALFYVIFRKISDISSAFFSLSIYLFSFFLLYFLVEDAFYYSFLILSNSYHNGMFVMALICVLLSLIFFKKESWITLVALFVLSAISCPCDKLFIVAYTVPIIFTLLVLLIAGYSKRKILKLGLTCILGILLGMVILDKFAYNSVFHLTRPHQYLTLEAIMDSWKIFSTQIKIDLSKFTFNLSNLSNLSFNSLTIILSIIAYIWTIYYCIVEFIAIRRKKKAITLFFVFQLFVLFFTVMVMLAPIINGSYMGYDCIRYNYFIFIVLSFNFILLASTYVKKQKYLIIGSNSFFAIMLATFLFWEIHNMDFVHQLNNYFSSYTERAYNLDKQFPNDNVTRYGITNDYWYAKHATMFSRNNIRLYNIHLDASPNLHVSNENWYYAGSNGKYSNPQFTFLLWSLNEQLPDFFIEQNSPHDSCMIKEENKMLYFVQPFIFDRETKQPKLLQ